MKVDRKNHYLMNTEVTINPEFQKLIPPLHPSELEQLEANILRDGCRDPLVVWSHHPESGYCRECHKDTDWETGDGNIKCRECGFGCAPIEAVLLDGHNRYAICEAHGLEFDTVGIELPDHQAAVNWIILNQLGRRNLSPDAATVLLGKLYQARKKEHGGDRKSEAVESIRQNDGLKETETAEQVAKETRVSPRTVERAAAFVRAADKLGITDDIVAGKVDAPRATIIEVAKALPENPTPAQVDEAKAKIPHVANNSGDNEWYTPPEFIEAAKAVLGEIDLDPASSPIANRNVGATKFFTKEDDGLTQAWEGRVWMNPPYAQPLCSQFCERVATAFETEEIKAAIVLVNNATETRWFQRMFRSAAAACFPEGRIRFLKPEGIPGAPLQGQAFVYFGRDTEAFRVNFEDFGTVVTIPQ